jgi:hypothetical protein
VAIKGSWTPGSRFPGVPTSSLLPFVVGGPFLTIGSLANRRSLGSAGDG